MLKELNISNIALVDSLALSFSPGMNCLTGETGAGKSILAGALGLIRGNKGEVDLIRHGTDEASVSAVFSLQSSDAKAWLEEHAFPRDDDQILLRRVIRRNGKGSIFIQGQAATLKDLTELAGHLFDMHGQHEHQNLFNVEQHRLLLDRFGSLEENALDFYRSFSALAAQRLNLEQFKTEQADKERHRDSLEFGLNEIQLAKLQIGEDLELENEKRRSNQAERLFSLCNQADMALSEGEPAALGLIFGARAALQDISKIDPEMSDCSERLSTLYFDLEDIARSVAQYTASLQFEPGRIDQLEERLDLIGRLKKKYGSNIEQILIWAENAQTSLDSLESSDEQLEDMQAKIKEAEAAVYNKATVLSVARKKAALRLQEAVSGSLNGLGMAKTRFELSINQKMNERGTPVCGPWGIDNVEFMMSANPGEPLRSIRSIASGGELSRVMLSIKGALADSDQVPSLVFDEVDTGIGGEVAVALGEHLYGLSASKQILAITHLASIAVRADNHIRVEKFSQNDRTSTLARRVQGQERVEEVARMLAGDRTGEASLRHAGEMLARFHQKY